MFVPNTLYPLTCLVPIHNCLIQFTLQLSKAHKGCNHKIVQSTYNLFSCLIPLQCLSFPIWAVAPWNKSQPSDAGTRLRVNTGFLLRLCQLLAVKPSVSFLTFPHLSPAQVVLNNVTGADLPGLCLSQCWLLGVCLMPPTEHHKPGYARAEQAASCSSAHPWTLRQLSKDFLSGWNREHRPEAQFQTTRLQEQTHLEKLRFNFLWSLIINVL